MCRHMAESMCRHIFSFSRDCQAVLQNGCTHLFSHSVRYWSLNSLHPHEHFISFFSTSIGILVDVSWYLIMVFTSLMTNKAESLHMVLPFGPPLCEMLFNIFIYFSLSYLFLLICGCCLYIVDIRIANIFLQLVFWGTEVPKVWCILFYFFSCMAGAFWLI